MNIKKRIINFINELKKLKLVDIDEDEFDVELENHELGNQKIYRLHYINYHNIGTGSLRKCRGVIDWTFKPFMLPNGMKREESFIVLSYLTDFIEKNTLVGEASLSSVRTLDSVIDLERFGFKRLEIQPADSEIIDLFTVSGRIKRFKNSEYYPKYFNWYTENISKEEVEEIYKRCGMSFRNLVFSNPKSNSNENKKDNKVQDENTKNNISQQFEQVNSVKVINDSKMKLYGFVGIFNEKFFDTKDELDEFVNNVNESSIYKVTIDYIGQMADRTDVIKITYRDGTSKYLTAIDEHGYAVYDEKKSLASDDFVWNFEYGDLREIYAAFRNRGIRLENDMYAKYDELNHFINEKISANYSNKNNKKLTLKKDSFKS